MQYICDKYHRLNDEMRVLCCSNDMTSLNVLRKVKGELKISSYLPIFTCKDTYCIVIETSKCCLPQNTTTCTCILYCQQQHTLQFKTCAIDTVNSLEDEFQKDCLTS